MGENRAVHIAIPDLAFAVTLLHLVIRVIGKVSVHTFSTLFTIQQNSTQLSGFQRFAQVHTLLQSGRGDKNFHQVPHHVSSLLLVCDCNSLWAAH